MLTRRGTEINQQTLLKILNVMTNPEYDGASQQRIAKAAGLSRWTLQNYLTDEVWELIRQRRLQVVQHCIGDVDRAVLAKALEGNMQAAKMIYARWDAMKQEEKTQLDELPEDLSLEELESELAALQSQMASGGEIG